MGGLSTETFHHLPWKVWQMGKQGSQEVRGFPGTLLVMTFEPNLKPVTAHCTSPIRSHATYSLLFLIIVAYLSGTYVHGYGTSGFLGWKLKESLRKKDDGGNRKCTSI